MTAITATEASGPPVDGRQGVAASARELSPGPCWLLLLPTLALFLLVFVAPVLGLVKTSLFDPDFTLRHYRLLLSEDLFLRIIWRTLWVSALVALLTLLLGYPVALLMARLKGTGALIIAGCVLLPLWISVLVRSYAWVVLLAHNGVVTKSLRDLGLIAESTRFMYTDGTVIVAMTHVLLPFMILPLYASLNAIPDDLLRAAKGLGAGDLRAFLRVTLPLSLPGVLSGAILVFVIALGFFVTPALVGGPKSMMAAMLIGQEAAYGGNWGLAAALSAVLFFGALAVVLAFGRFIRLDGDAEVGGR